MREQLKQLVERINESADQLRQSDNLMSETLHGIADDLESAIRPQWVPVDTPPCHSQMVMVSYRYPDGAVITHWHEIDYPEPPEATPQ